MTSGQCDASWWQQAGGVTVKHSLPHLNIQNDLMTLPTISVCSIPERCTRSGPVAERTQLLAAVQGHLAQT